MKIHVSKTKWYFALLNLFLLILVFICILTSHLVAATLESVHAADRWRGSSEMPFAQIGCYMPIDAPKAEEDIRNFRSVLEQKLIDNSLEAEEGGHLYSDAYSGIGELTVTGDHGTASVKAIGVGGNFFLFHPLQLLSGSYISGEDLMQDRVVLDEVLAWQLFGGQDVAGLTVSIQGKPYYVAGVVRRENDFASKEAYLDGAGMFISYNAFHELTQQEITCYELVMPNMIAGFAKGIVDENFSVGKGDIVENSSRYSLENLLTVAKNYGLRSMRNNGVIYPYWENAVRLTEDYLALLLVLTILLALCPFVSTAILCIRTFTTVYRGAKQKIPSKFDELRERKREENYLKAGD